MCMCGREPLCFFFFFFSSLSLFSHTCRYKRKMVQGRKSWAYALNVRQVAALITVWLLISSAQGSTVSPNGKEKQKMMPVLLHTSTNTHTHKHRHAPPPSTTTPVFLFKLDGHKEKIVVVTCFSVSTTAVSSFSISFIKYKKKRKQNGPPSVPVFALHVSFFLLLCCCFFPSPSFLSTCISASLRMHVYLCVHLPFFFLLSSIRVVEGHQTTKIKTSKQANNNNKKKKSSLLFVEGRERGKKKKEEL